MFIFPCTEKLGEYFLDQSDIGQIKKVHCVENIELLTSIRVTPLNIPHGLKLQECYKKDETFELIIVLLVLIKQSNFLHVKEHIFSEILMKSSRQNLTYDQILTHIYMMTLKTRPLRERKKNKKQKQKQDRTYLFQPH